MSSEAGHPAKAIVFAYHDVGARCLATLLAHGVDVTTVVTHEDDPGEAIWFASVAELAARYGIPVIAPRDPNTADVIAALAAQAPDFLFSFYYRRMLRPELLALARRGAYNMHGSLLPKYRGRAPVNWAVLHGERETGASLHEMVVKPDAGRIFGQQSVPILPDDTAGEVMAKVTCAAEVTLDRCLPALLAGTLPGTEQDLSAGTYFGGRKPEDGRIDWSACASSIHNLIRAVAPPFPGAFSDTCAGRVRFLRSLHPTDASGNHPRPVLFAADGALWAQCGDRRLLRLVAVESAGRAIDAVNFETLVGSQPISLT